MAAVEMKNRVLKTLKEIVLSNELDKIHMASNLCDELQISPQELKLSCQQLLNCILHNYSDLSISTIDKFTFGIVKTFAHDLNLPIQFNVELNEKVVYEKVVSLLIDEIGVSEEITNFLSQFIISNLKKNESWQIENSLLKIISLTGKENMNQQLDQFSKIPLNHFLDIEKNITHNINNYVTQLSNDANKALTLLTKNHITEEHLYQGKKGVFGLLKKLENLEDHAKELYTVNELFNTYVTASIEQNKWASSKADDETIATLNGLTHELSLILNDIKQYQTEHFEKIILYQIIQKNIYSIGILHELTDILKQYKQDEEKVFISEFNIKISELIKNEPTPFIYEKIGNRYKHFLIDEFQDTSTLQWLNLLPLIDDSLSNGNINLIVGDAKQSIYRWRNANVNQFAKLPLLDISQEQKSLIDIAREKKMIENFDLQNLNTNYRSTGTIINFNNQLFNYLKHHFLSSQNVGIYENHEQLVSKNNLNEGYVQVQFFDSAFNDALFETQIIHPIEQALKDGYTYKDICIIVRKNNIGSEIANYLLSRQYPVITSESLLLKNAKEVKTIICVLSLLLNQKDEIAAATIINFLHQIKIINDDNLYKYLKQIKQTPINIFTIIDELNLSKNSINANNQNVFETCVNVIEVLKLHEHNPLYIQFFLDEVLEFTNDYSPHIFQFLLWWENKSNTASAIIPSGVNAINIMTIHKSKGLEFPVIIVPISKPKTNSDEFICRPLQNTELNLPLILLPVSKKPKDTIYKSDIEQENEGKDLDDLNILYVAFTRAIDRLYISCVGASFKEDTTSNNLNQLMYQYFKLQPEFNNELKKYQNGSLKKQAQSHPANEIIPINSNGGLATLQFNTSVDIIKIKQPELELPHQTTALERGIIIHNMLASLNSIEDFETIFNSNEALLSHGDYENIKINIKNILQSSIVSEYYKSGLTVKNEYSILTHNGYVMRPDRLVLIDNKAIIIDYKSGNQTEKKYYNQMNAYKSAMFDLGYQFVEQYLIYVDTFSVISIH